MKLQNERKKKYKAKQGKMRSEKRNLKKKKNTTDSDVKGWKNLLSRSARRIFSTS